MKTTTWLILALTMLLCAAVLYAFRYKEERDILQHDYQIVKKNWRECQGITNGVHPPFQFTNAVRTYATVSQALAAASVSNSVFNGSNSYTPTNCPQLTTNDVRSGAICALIGEHTWRGHLHVTLEYVEGKMGCRECALCFTHQTLYETWR